MFCIMHQSKCFESKWFTFINTSSLILPNAIDSCSRMSSQVVEGSLYTNCLMWHHRKMSSFVKYRDHAGHSVGSPLSIDIFKNVTLLHLDPHVQPFHHADKTSSGKFSAVLANHFANNVGSYFHFDFNQKSRSNRMTSNDVTLYIVRPSMMMV